MKKNNAQKIRFFLFLGAGFAMLFYFLPSQNEEWNFNNIFKSILESFGFSFVIFYISYWFSKFIDNKISKDE